MMSLTLSADGIMDVKQDKTFKNKHFMNNDATLRQSDIFF